jgi:hypothetical protein
MENLFELLKTEMFYVREDKYKTIGTIFIIIIMIELNLI